MPSATGGQDWLVSWHRPDDPPTGRAHRAAGVCVADGDQLVLISRDGVLWGFPAGRPEAGAYWRAEVEVHVWQPRFEILHRDPDEVATRISLQEVLKIVNCGVDLPAARADAVSPAVGGAW